MNLFLRHMIVGAVLGMASFGVCSAENSTVTPKADNTAPKTENLTAQTLIAKMTEIYKNCTSYLDSGVVNTSFFMKKGDYVDKVPFTTAFKRSPRQFRFWFSSQAPQKNAEIKHHIILVKNKEVIVWQNAETGIEKESSLSDAIADAVAVSGGAAQTIPVLIGAHSFGGKSIADLNSPKRIEDAFQDGVMCYRIQEQRTLADAGPVTIWINKKTFLIHRIDSSQKFKDFRTETTKIYKPQINIPIDESKFALNAPKQVKKAAK